MKMQVFLVLVILALAANLAIGATSAQEKVLQPTPIEATV
jgi:hypothetical protein